MPFSGSVYKSCWFYVFHFKIVTVDGGGSRLLGISFLFTAWSYLGLYDDISGGRRATSGL